MDYVVIASVVANNKLEGFRVLDKDTMEVSELSLKSVYNLLRNGFNFQNVDIEDDEVVITQGNLDRYASIYKNDNEVLNSDSIVVLGYSVDYKGKATYTILNYRGQLVCIDKDSLIEYGSKYTIANCEVVQSDNGIDIKSLGEDIIEYSGHFYIESKNLNLTVTLPLDFDGTLLIPSYINSNPVLAISSIEIEPPFMASKVNTLLLESESSYLHENAARKLKNLKNLGLKGNIHDYKIDIPSIETIYANGLGSYTEEAFMGNRNLINVTFEDNPKFIPAYSFAQCESLDITSLNNLLKEGLVGIEIKAFDGCKFKEVNLPNSLRYLHHTAFNNCEHINVFRIKNSELTIRNSSEYFEEATRMEFTDIPDDEKILGKCPSATLYVPQDFPDSLLKRYFSNKVTIVREGNTSYNDKIELKVNKAKLLGYSLRVNNIQQEDKEFLGVLKISDKEEWRNKFIEYLKTMLSTEPHENTVNLNGLHLKYAIPNAGYYNEASIKFIGEDYIVLGDEYGITAITVGKELIEAVVENAMGDNKNNQLEYYSYYGAAGSEPIDIDFILSVPSKFIDLESKNVKSINEKDGTLYIEIEGENTISLNVRNFM